MLETDVFQTFRSTAAKFGHKCAIRFDSHEVSYERLLDGVERLANVLHHRGVSRSDQVAILLPNSPQLAIAYLAVLALGGAAVFIDPDADVAALTGLFRTLHLRGVLALERHQVKVEQAVRDAGDVPVRLYLGDGVDPQVNLTHMVAHSEPREFELEAAPESTALVCFTRGTTGQAKGVRFSREGLAAKLYSIRYTLALTSEHTVLCLSPLRHIFWNLVNLLAPLCSGSQVVVLPKYDPAELQAAFAAYANIVLFDRPEVFHDMAEWPPGSVDAGRVAFLICTQDFLSDRVSQAVRDKFGLPLLKSYGLSEGGPLLTLEDPWEKPRPLSVGLPCYGVQIKLDEVKMQGTILTDVGEILLKTTGGMKGYVSQGPSGPTYIGEDGWLRTGDLAQLDAAGRLSFAGRKSDLIVKGGFPVIRFEVENVLKSHPGISACRVVPIKSDLFGQELKALVVPPNGRGVSFKELSRFCQKRLQAYKCPKHFEVVETLN